MDDLPVLASHTVAHIVLATSKTVDLQCRAPHYVGHTVRKGSRPFIVFETHSQDYPKQLQFHKPITGRAVRN